MRVYKKSKNKKNHYSGKRRPRESYDDIVKENEMFENYYKVSLNFYITEIFSTSGHLLKILIFFQYRHKISFLVRNGGILWIDYVHHCHQHSESLG